MTITDTNREVNIFTNAVVLVLVLIYKGKGFSIFSKRLTNLSFWQLKGLNLDGAKNKNSKKRRLKKKRQKQGLRKDRK